MKIKNLALSTLLAFALGSQVNAQERLHLTPIRNFSELQEYFRYQDNKKVIISGHRGGMLPGYPENSIEAMEKTLEYTPSFFEIDPQLTKDSVIILMHDKTFDRTTNLSGNVSDFTYAELKDVKLKDRQGNLTPYKIPTLKEVLDWGKDKTIFNLDNKSIPWHKYVELFKDSDYKNIVLSVRSMEEALYYYERLDQVMLCVAIKNFDDLEAFKATKIPFNRIMAYVGPEMNPEYNDMYDYLRKNGVMCFISIHPTADRNVDDMMKMKAYTELLMGKPDIVETDYPAYFFKSHTHN